MRSRDPQNTSITPILAVVPSHHHYLHPYPSLSLHRHHSHYHCD
ncbi:hypothetical protein [Piscirickettsia salmonis]